MSLGTTTDRPTLQPGRGAVLGEHYLPSRVDEVRWGWLPNADASPVLHVADGATVTLDTVSHEGLLPDQGRDPARYIRQFGDVDVLDDAVEIAGSGIARGPGDGPHVVTGPIAVAGARPGDALRVDVLDLARRVPYGFVSNRHGFGALAGEYPQDRDSTPTRHVDRMITNGAVSHFAWVEERAGRDVGVMDAGGGRTVQFALAPFLGLMGTAPATSAPVPSVPPGDHGGNIDIKHAGVGATLYLPVAVDGALFYAGDPHFAQGNGEVALTALEASLRATVRLSVVAAADLPGVLGDVRMPVVETATHWIPTGMDPDLDEAMRQAVRHAVAFLHGRFGVPRSVALAYLSAAGDFEVSQVVDAVKGVHCLIAKADWAAWT
ncbi:acetamidase/formamidase family protein [Cellulomonas dongxiuzhuiae]|uniref:Acetamidase/formamidase family protein n=1 Tax=Cellulomonas dongxiuzhuiae TaxID=2819979 RepID=A0ABX8GHX1_9CELL|nr:acetamidase/formamidase family protein [Cellulomonas dongxiuzhuiae]MBO3094405.1 acetamidase/formamidase family protein [Cellulomonas dongxiuzhuiae]QWC15433.1 acetamidase/formamidase family protein [Cellulomonas dongxiuzhuiae]